MNKTSKQQLGQKGEELSVAFLSGKGHRIIGRNYRHGKGELDIVSIENRVVVISEVKSYVSEPLGAPEFRVHKQKQRQIIRTAYAFLAEHPELEGFDVRFDILIVDFSSYPARITQHQAAFWDEEGWDGWH